MYNPIKHCNSYLYTTYYTYMHMQTLQENELYYLGRSTRSEETQEERIYDTISWDSENKEWVMTILK